MLCLNLIDEPRKRCTGCKRRHPVSYFCRTKATKDGYHTRCRGCRGKKDRAYYQANRERLLEKQRRYYEDNAEAVKKYHRELYEGDKATKIRKIQAAKDARPEWRRKRLAKPVTRLADILRTRLRKTLNGKGVNARSAVYDRLGYRQSDLREHLLALVGFMCPVCDSSLVSLPGSEIDHIIPLRTARSEDDVWDLCRLDNLRLVCSRCNKRPHKEYGG